MRKYEIFLQNFGKKVIQTFLMVNLSSVKFISFVSI